MIDDDDDDRIDSNTVKHPKSDHSKCEDLLVTYRRSVPMTNEPQGISSILVREFIACNFQDTICVGLCCYWMFFVYSE